MESVTGEKCKVEGGKRNEKSKRRYLMKKEYEAPKVITYAEDEIIEMLGPAQTCSPSPCPTYN